MGITQAEAARILGVTPQAIRQRLKSGSLTRLADGTLDRREVEIVAALRSPSRSTKVRGVAEGKPKTKRASLPPKVATDPGVDLIKRELRALARYQRRLARRYRLGLGPGPVGADVVNGHLFNVRIEAIGLLEERVSYFARELGYSDDEIAEVVDEAWGLLSVTGLRWLGAAPDGMIRVVFASPRWRRRGRDVAGVRRHEAPPV